MLLLYIDDEVVAETKVGKPDLVKEHDGRAIRLASWKDPAWNFIGVIDEVGVFNEGLSANTLQDISSGGLERAMSVSTESKLTTTWAFLKTLSDH